MGQLEPVMLKLYLWKKVGKKAIALMDRKVANNLMKSMDSQRIENTKMPLIYDVR